MNTNHDELERMLGRDLHDQVDGMTGVPFGFDDVKGRAGRIRRNRRIAAGVGVAAALAVIVPTAITAGGMLQSKGDLQPAPSPDAPVEVARTTLTLDGLERGDAPAIEYFTPDGVVLPGEGLQPLSKSYQALVPEQETGGWFAYGADRTSVEFLDENFEGDGGGPATGGFATTPDRDYVSWTQVGPDGSQLLGVHSTTDLNGVTTWEFPEFPVVNPVGILGPDSAVYETVTSQGETKVGLANPDGSTTELRYLRVRGADPVNGRISVLTKVKGSSGCFAVVDVATLVEAWETCDYSLGAFSPDGEYVMATNADSDGLGLSEVDVLDAETGDLVARFSQSGASQIALVGTSWESADSMVAVAVEGETQTIVRMGLDGTLEETVDPVTGTYGDLYFYMGADRARL